MKMRIFLSVVLMSCFVLTGSAQRKAKKDTDEGYQFTDVVRLDATPVKNQAGTGTCWCFATTSFMESELLRMGKGEFDLSEMFIVRNNYAKRIADNYLRRGKGNLGQGSLSHDWAHNFRAHGIVPEEVYDGINYDSETHNHRELNPILGALANVAVERRINSEEMQEVIECTLDTYLGEVPENFTYKGKSYTPKSFAEYLGLNMDDYVEITSFSHFPMYGMGQIEVTDNWTHDPYYNVPLEDLMTIIDEALTNGYTIAWDGDVGESGFAHGQGVAVIPDVEEVDNFTGTDRARFEKMPVRDRVREIMAMNKPFPEKKITQEMRQEGYETFATTDDHLMHLTGIVKDQNGTKYYITKNSWGTARNDFGGYLHMSESYVAMKTIAIMIHKDAIPANIKAKIGL
jgi:bleomycin hydrolase